jgi:hypothetical protein
MDRNGYSMRAVILGLTLAAAVAGGRSDAQTLRDSTGPAEVPPAGYAASQYVDSKGCVFVRAGYAGQVTWVPRVTRDRKVICGQVPTLAGQAQPKAAQASAAEALAPVAQPARPAGAALPRPSAAQPAPVAPAAAGDLTLVSVTTVPAGGTGCAGKTTTAERFTLSDGRTILRCGAPVADPVAYLNGAGLGVTVSGAAPVRQAQAPAARLPEGYEPAWQDDRLNPRRGESANAAGPVAGPVVRPAAAEPAPAAAGTGGDFVQVGAFSVAANAGAAADRLRALGLPVSEQATRIGGKAATIVLAGPFAPGAEARAALARLRASGFADAFLR